LIPGSRWLEPIRTSYLIRFSTVTSLAVISTPCRLPMRWERKSFGAPFADMRWVAASTGDSANANSKGSSTFSAVRHSTMVPLRTTHSSGLTTGPLGPAITSTYTILTIRAGKVFVHCTGSFGAGGGCVAQAATPAESPTNIHTL